jgi:uncharacterized protein (TIGR02145 family)
VIVRLVILTLIQVCFLFSQTQIAVVNFVALGVSDDDSKALTNRLMIEMHRTNQFTVLEREMLDKIIEEQKFQLSGCNSDVCLVELGQIANVQQIVGGSISKVGYIYTITARLISVQSGEVVESASFDFAGDIGELMRFGMTNIASQLASIPIPEEVIRGETANTANSIQKKIGSQNFIGTVSDIDGNVYKTVKIGNQIWMAENLKVTHYQNGDKIATGFSHSDWKELTKGAYSNYNDDIKNVNTYGRLYNWYAVSDLRNIVPKGWHVPNDEEWQELELYLGIDSDLLVSRSTRPSERGTNEGEKLKEGMAWVGRNGTNLLGFTALPAGERSFLGKYEDIGLRTYFWTSTEGGEIGYSSRDHAYYRSLSSRWKTITRRGTVQSSGFSVRCIKD